MPPLKPTAEEIADEQRWTELLHKLSQRDVPAFRAAGFGAAIDRCGVLNDDEQAEYDAIAARIEARLAAERRAPEEIFTDADNERMRQIGAHRGRGLTPDEQAEIEALFRAWQLAKAISSRGLRVGWIGEV